jgi:hypothetical protein
MWLLVVDPALPLAQLASRPEARLDLHFVVARGLARAGRSNPRSALTRSPEEPAP